MESYSFDLWRIFLGDMPAWFYVEVALRAVILYFYTLAIIRAFGKRNAGQLTVVDVVVIIVLGSAMGDPVFNPNTPLLQGILVITIIVGLQRLGLYWINRNAKADRLLKGRPHLVVSNGVLNLEGLEHVGISKREIFQMARQQGFRSLGEIRRMYIETDDEPSIFPYEPDEVRPGLQFEPPWEIDQLASFQEGDIVKQQSTVVCLNCGQTLELDQGEAVRPCPHCGEVTWTAVT